MTKEGRNLFAPHLLKMLLRCTCHNPNLGLATKAPVCKRLGQERDLWVWENVKMNSHTPKWTPMLGVGVPVDSQNFRNRLQKEKLVALMIYITRKLLKHRCPKWARMTHLDIYNTSYGQKKSWSQFDSRPWKGRNQPDSLACRWHATHHWKALDEGYNFGLDPISIEGLHKKLWSHKVADFRPWWFWDSHLRIPGQKAIQMPLL